MNGDRFLLDTNAIIALLAGNRSLSLLLSSADWVGISIISYLEFLSFDGLCQDDRDCFEQLVSRVEVIPVSLQQMTIMQSTISIRTTNRLKLPDALIAATTQAHHATLITNDAHFNKVPALAVLGY